MTKLNNNTTTLIDSFVSTVFLVHKTKLRCLCKVLLATFIYHEEWNITNYPGTSVLLDSAYFNYSVTVRDRRSMVRTSLPWEHHEDAPSLTGIPIHCSMLNKLMEIHTMQRKLPDAMMDLFIRELDERNMGGGMNASRIVDAIQRSSEDMKNSLIRHMEQMQGGTRDRMRNRPNDEASSSLGFVQNAIQATMNNDFTPGDTIAEVNIPLISEEDGIWGHYWDGEVHGVPYNFNFSANKTLLSLWHSWHLPDVKNRVCPYKFLKARDVCMIKRGATKLGEMKMVIDCLLDYIKNNSDLFARYKIGMHDIRELTNLFHISIQVYRNGKRKNDRIGQLSWETFVRDARAIRLSSQIPISTCTTTSRRIKQSSPTPISTSASRRIKQSSPTPISTSTTTTRSKARKLSSPTPTSISTSTSRRKTQVSKKCIPISATTTCSKARRKRPTLCKKSNKTRKRQKTTSTSLSSSSSTNTSESRNETSKPNHLQLHRNGLSFISVTCPLCNTIPTIHRCLAEVKGGFLYNGKKICGKVFCAPCGTSWGNEGAPWRCANHMNHL